MDLSERVKQSLTTPVLIGVAAPFFLPAWPATFVAGLTAITFAPSDLAQYYRQIHESFLMMNEAIAHVKYSPCWDPEATDQWRAFRSKWIRFYSEGPSRWWVLSGDKSQADDFARGLVWWRNALAQACGQSATAPVQEPVSNPFYLQPLPAADPDVQAAAQLKRDQDELNRLIAGFKPEEPTPFWKWATFGGAGLILWLLWGRE